MVSTSTRRLPSTAIEATVWAAAGADTSPAASVAATGTANMIRAARKPPRTRIPKIMRNAPLSFQVVANGQRHKKAASRCRQMQDVVISREHHQHQHEGEPDSEPDLLRANRQRTSPDRLDGIEQKVTAIEQWH